MFDVGFTELLLILSIGLLILGPERLPGVVKTVSYWVRKAKASVEEAKYHISQELQVDEIEKNIGNYNEHLKAVKQTITKNTDIDAVNESIGKVFSSAKKESSGAAVTNGKTASKKTTPTKKAASKKTTTKASTASEKQPKRASTSASLKTTASTSGASKKTAVSPASNQSATTKKTS